MDSSIDQQFVAYVVKSLVNHPDDVQVDRRVDEKGVLLELTVNPEDLGRVIGKRGATAQSLRTLLRALGTKNEARYNLKIIDNGEGAPTAEAGTVASAGVATVAADDQPAASVPADSAATDSTAPRDEDDVVSKTRRELEELDDLDV